MSKNQLLRSGSSTQRARCTFVKGNSKYAWPIGNKVDYKVHHFKWFAPALRRGIEPYILARSATNIARNGSDFIAHYELENRIQVEMPELKAHKYETFPVENK